jgi:hypothetical protein
VTGVRPSLLRRGEMSSEGSRPTADFEIAVCQGQDVPGADSVTLSELLAQGKPIVVNL